MKILALTSVYPSEERMLGFTPIVHYFAKEWVKQGHEVKVIHNQSRFLFFFYMIPKFLRNYFESKLGFKFPTKRMRTEKIYTLDNVNVHQIPIFRIFPFVNFFSNSIQKQIAKILLSNKKDDFIPDVILSHWIYPQLPIMIALKKQYNCPCSLVLHGINKKEISEDSIKELDAIGFRSLSIKDKFYQLSRVIPNKAFMCYSGIKDEYIIEKQICGFDSSIHRFIYVGTLLKRKHIESIIKMLPIVYNDCTNYTLEIIGSGPEEKYLKNLAKDLTLAGTVRFHQELAHKQVILKMQEAECFIMISSHEVFGLVYIEAMSQGCIVVASKNEGMEGIIENGINGFLCTAGDYLELSKVVTYINQLTTDERRKVSLNAIKTANALKESTVAYNYLQSVMNGF
jgi:glycosyltransferase involved in cell wall biosynthesis